MPIIPPKTWSGLAVAAALGALVSTSTASAQNICFPEPIALPLLYLARHNGSPVADKFAQM